MKKLLEFLLVFGGVGLLLWGGKNMTQYLTTSIFSAPAGGVNSASGLVAYWDMNLDGGSTGTVYDLSQNSYNGTNSGATATEGKIGAAMNFDSLSDKVTSTAEIVGTGDDSVSAWIYAPTTLGNERLQIVNNGKFILEAYGYGLHRILFASDGGTNASAGNGSLLYGRWLHVVVTRTSAGTANIYINGVLSGTANQASGTPAAGTTNLIIGNRNGADQGFRGTIDEVRLYNKILSTDEITALYNQGANVGKVILNSQADSSQGLIGWWPLRSEDEVPSNTNSVTNGSAWTDTNSDGLADNWAIVYGGEVNSIVTGNGFDGRAQRLTGTGYRAIATSANVFTSGKKYAYSFKYRSDNDGGTIDIRNGVTDNLVSNLTDNTGDAILKTGTFTATTTNNLRFRIHTESGANAFIEIDDVAIYEIQTEDLSPSGNHGSITPGSGGYTTDNHSQANGAYDFDGSATRINLPAGNYLNNPSAYTMSAWIKADAWGSYPAIALFDFNTGANDPSGLVFAAGKPLFLHDDNVNGQGSTTALSTGVWYFLTGVWNGTNRKIYVNGVDVSGNDLGGDWNVAGNTIGLGYLNEEFNGAISDVRLYNRALSPAEITALSNSYNPSMRGSSHTKGLVGHWPLTTEAELFGGPDLLAGWNFTTWASVGGGTRFANSWTNDSNGSGVANTTILTVGTKYRLTIVGSMDGGSLSIGGTQATNQYMTVDSTTPFSHTITFTATYGSQLTFYNTGDTKTTTITSITLQKIQASDLGVGAKNGAYVAAPEVGSRGTKFDGSSQYIDIGDTAQTAVKTISFWTQADDITSHTDYPIDLNGTDYISIVNGEVTLGGFTGGTNTIYTDSVSAEATIPDSTGWHHVVVTSTTGRNASDLDIARLEATGYHDGKIADVKMWDRALSATEVTQLYKQGRPTSSVDYAANFNGSTQYFTLADSGSAGSAEDFDIVADQDFMFEAWIKTLNKSQFGVFGGKRGATNGAALGWMAFLYNDSSYFELGDGTNNLTVSSSLGLENNTWMHFVGTYDASADQITLYTNGVSRNSNTNASVGALTNTSSLTLGITNTIYFNGSMDNARIYNFGADGLPSNISSLVAENASEMGKIAPGLQSYLVDGWDFNGGGFALKDARHDLTNTGSTPFVKVR